MHELPPKTVHSTKEQLDAMHIPNNFRDQCVDYLVILRRCRKENNHTLFSSCHDEKHMYEHCVYELHQEDKLRLAKKE